MPLPASPIEISGTQGVMKKTMPLVSVIMPVHSAGKFLVPAIESILKQTYPRFELIIVNDGSTDASWRTICAYRKKCAGKIKAFRSKTKLNEAGNAATNIGLLHAKGQFIARMDADDIAHPKRLEKQVAYFATRPGTILVGTQALVIDERSRCIGEKTVPLENGDIYRQYAVIHPIIHPSVMINRNMLPDPNMLYACKYGINDDYYTFFKLLPYGKFANLPETLIKYRVHTGNSSLTNLKQNFWNINTIRWEAISKLNYQAPLWVFPLILLQTAIVAFLQENQLKELFYYIRGIKKLSIKFRFPEFETRQFRESVMEKIKSYAATFLA